MATSEIDGLITKATVILDKPEDWQEWIFLRKDSANQNGIWNMVDLDRQETKLEKL